MRVKWKAFEIDIGCRMKTRDILLQAYWNEAVAGISIPSISAHKGNVTCVIQPPDPPDSTCKTVTGDNPLGYAITEADATTFAQLLGKVCNDVFAASK